MEEKENMFDHFEDIDDLLKTIDMWYETDEIYYERWFGLNDLYKLSKHIKQIQKERDELKKENEKLKEKIDKVREIFEEWERVLPDGDKIVESLLNNKVKFRGKEINVFTSASGFYTCVKQLSKKVLFILENNE